MAVLRILYFQRLRRFIKFFYLNLFFFVEKNNCEITIDRSACADMSQIETSKIVITKSGCGKRKASKAPIEKLCKTGGKYSTVYFL
jgi:hypothetical protein